MSSGDDAGPHWELSKENTAPLQRGRNVSTLTEKKKRNKETSSEEEYKQQQQMIQHYERLLLQSSEDDTGTAKSEANNNDPLIHWLAYIRFHQETFPANTHEQFLLMERCTRALLGDIRYSNDVRFIRVCVTYADKTQFPGDVFKYLHSQQVGNETALFWIAWAWVAENKGDYAFAEKVYLKGLAKEAAPLKVLQQRHKQFQRRMSRHWLNTSKQHDEEQEGSEKKHGRATLAGLDEERVRRNDRRTRPDRGTQQGRQPPGDQSLSTFQEKNLRTKPQGENEGASNALGSRFQIFVDENDNQNHQGNGYDLDQSRGKDYNRELETEAERNQENKRAAEAWNERGAYATRYGAPVTQDPRPLSFAVHIDAECADRQIQTRSQEQAHFDRLRRDRDRAFRERTEEAMAEKLTKDPMKYIRDPSKLPAPEPKEVTDSKPKASISCGFNKKLLANDASGQEQCFEERRMLARFYILTNESENFNLLVKDESRMDEDSIEDVEMEEEDERSNDVTTPVIPSRRVLFSLNVSVDSQSNSFIFNASTASSTINERDAVGVAVAKEEETINTKLAMKELSMMFSSPAMGLEDDDAPIAQRARLNSDVNSDNETATFSLIHGLIDDGEQCGLNNSLIQEGSDENANRVGNPHARTNFSRSFGNSVLRAVEGDDDSRMLAIQPAPICDPGFEIFADQSYEEESKPVAKDSSEIPRDKQPPSTGIGFSIFEDSDDRSDKKPAATAKGFSIFCGNHNDASLRRLDANQPVSAKIPFTIYHEHDEADSDIDGDEGSDGAGDTASLSIFGEAMDVLRDVGTKKRPTSSMCSIPGIQPVKTDLCIHLDDDLDVSIRKLLTVYCTVSFTHTLDIAIQIDGFEKYKVGDAGDVLTGYSPAFGDISQIIPEDVCRMSHQQSPTVEISMMKTGSAVEYTALHKDDIRNSLRKLDQEARKSSNRRPFSRESEEMDLGTLLSTKGTVRDMPTQSMPQALKKKTSTQGSEISVGNKCGVIKHELGRGSYGVVIMLETDHQDCNPNEGGIVAVKAQSPTDCLAWEYEVMRKLEERVSLHYPRTASSPFPFPLPLSFVSLSDGGLLGMTAGSSTGMNLVDIVNVYKTCEGCPVPELIAIHYTSRMLKHIETLHWHGKILHCDAKPDNWVLMASQTAFDGCGSILEASDLMLVDFGRSVDMEMCTKNGVDVMNVKLFGEATTEDMACVAMRKGYGWSFDIDTFGICASAHVLLFGIHMEIEQGRNRHWKPRKALRRYWQKELWSELFDTLLNLDEGSQTAMGSRPGNLRSLRQKLEAYVNGKSKELDSLLKHQARILPKMRPGN